MSSCSDHCPIVLHCLKEEERRTQPGCRRYEAMWERDGSLPERVAAVWEQAGQKFNLGDISSGLPKLMTELHAWSRKKLGNIIQEVEKSRSQLEEFMRMNADRSEIRKASDRLDELLYKEEMLWMQRSRIDWLKAGDRNTKFFHSKAVWRARKNKVRSLLDETGQPQHAQAVMGQIVSNYFQKIFQQDVTLNPNSVVDLFEEKVTPEMNDNLCADFTDKEISDAFFQIGPLKAPGRDVFRLGFFRGTGVF